MKRRIIFALLIVCMVNLLSSCVCPNRYYRDYMKWNGYVSEISRLNEAKEYAEAEKVAKEYLDYSKRRFGEGHSYTIIALQYLADIYKEQNRLNEAEETCKHALAIIDKNGLYECKNPCLVVLAGIYVSSGKLSEAESIYKDLVDDAKGGFGQRHPDVAVPLVNLARFYESNGKAIEARIAYDEASAIVANCRVKSYPQLKYALEALAEYYNKVGEEDKAKKLQERAQSISYDNYNFSHSSSL